MSSSTTRTPSASASASVDCPAPKPVPPTPSLVVSDYGYLDDILPPKPPDPPPYNPQSDPYLYYTEDFGPVLGPELSVLHVAVEYEEAYLRDIKTKYVQTLNNANQAKDRGELPTDQPIARKGKRP